MGSSESYSGTQPQNLRGIRAGNKAAARARQQRELDEHAEAVEVLLSKLAEANERPALRSQYEIVSPITRPGRLMSRADKKARMVPATTRHFKDKLDFVNYLVRVAKVTGHYLLLEPVIGYPLEAHRLSTTDAKRVLTVGGTVGKLLVPSGTHRSTYLTGGYGEENIKLLRDEDCFSVRQCEGIWQPSMRGVSSLGILDLRAATESLDGMLLDPLRPAQP